MACKRWVDGVSASTALGEESGTAQLGGGDGQADSLLRSTGTHNRQYLLDTMLYVWVDYVLLLYPEPCGPMLMTTGS